MARPKKTDDTEDTDEIATSEERLVPRELTEEQIDERRIQFANVGLEILDLEEKRRRQTKKANDRLAELKTDFRKLGEQLRTGKEMVPAQLALIPAVQDRRKVQRARQDAGAAVEP